MTRLAAPFLVGFIGFAGCGGPACENHAFFGLPSPDTASIAFVFHRTCGAEHAVTTDVTVLGSRLALRNEPGNVLEVDREQPVHVAWLNPQTLLVTGYVEPTHRRNEHVGPITIEFRPARSGTVSEK